MALIENIQSHVEQAQTSVSAVQNIKQDALVWEAFYSGFEYRFCWSSNSLEGNTLSLDETIEVLDFDEVSAGHTYSEYRDAKNLYRAIRETLSPAPTEITEEWMRKINGIVCDAQGEYRASDIFIGNAARAVYYPPNFLEVPALMQKYIEEADVFGGADFFGMITGVAKRHIQFERIHPFRDGNGRTGRIIMNQTLMNNGALPVAISHTSKYQQAFRIYDRNQDISLMVYLLCDALRDSAQSLTECYRKREFDRQKK
jgi:Fic family protein